MTRKLIMRDLSIGELFSGQQLFAIPYYQREYSWEREHARRLLDDIYMAMLDHRRNSEANPYFLGSVLVCDGISAPAALGEAARLDVVDGQQRIVTLTMLFACLRDLLKGAGAERLQGLITRAGGNILKLRDADAAFFARVVQSPGATRIGVPTLPDDASASHTNVRQNRNSLTWQLARLPPADREAAAAYLVEHCRVVLMQADDVDYAHQIFLSINERGKELTIEDIFQAELLGPLDADSQERYAPIIGHIGKYRRENRRNVSRGKTFFSHIAFAHGWSSHGIVKSIRDQIRQQGGPAEFTRNVFRPMADAYLEISGLVTSSRQLPPVTQAALANLRLLEMHGDDDWLSTAMLAWNRFAPEGAEFSQLIARLDRFAHILLALGFGGAARKGRYARINAAMLGEKPLASALAQMSVGKDDDKLALRNIAQKMHTIDRTSCRLILLRVDAHLGRRPLSYYEMLPGFHLRGENPLTVEHLLPKGEKLKPAYREEWERHFKDPRHRQATAQYLGNLTLVPEDENHVMEQKSFADKKDIMLEDKPHALYITEMLREVREWRLQAIVDRHRIMMQAVKEIWDLDGTAPEPQRAPRPARR
jgi:hypothetical protein